jgi:hypothetical protein
MGAMRTAYKMLVGKPEENRPLGRHRRRWEDNIKMDPRETGLQGVDFIRLDQDRDHWWGHLNTIMKLRVPYKAGNFD